MRTAITGHTAGLGEAIASRLAQDGHEILGFSLENGYDISKEEDQERIVEAVSDCEVFVNCAHDRVHHGIDQVSILNQVFYEWQDQAKHIISIGSNAPDTYTTHYHAWVSKYRAAKAALDAATTEINALYKPCRATIVRPSWIDSEAAARVEEHDGIKLAKLRYEEVADIVAMIVDHGPKITISSITISRTLRAPQQKAKKWWGRQP